jgi:predicted RNA-binding Zn-ribbon protein involved in translation (DUF1610 family)
MAEKLSKTARASLGDKGASFVRPCPTCGTHMVATRVIKYRQVPGGMYWVCPKDGERIKI